MRIYKRYDNNINELLDSSMRDTMGNTESVRQNGSYAAKPTETDLLFMDIHYLFAAIPLGSERGRLITFA